MTLALDIPRFILMTSRDTLKKAKPLAIGEAARRIGVSVDTLRRWDKDGKITSFRTPGKQRRFDPIAVEALKLPNPPQSSSSVADVPTGTRSEEERFTSAGDAA